MSRFLSVATLAVLALTAGAVRGDDEPMFRDRPLSAWIAVLTSDKEVRHRQGALIALERIGIAKSDKVLPAVNAALASAEQDDVVREAAAQALGRMFDRFRQEGGNVRWDSARDTLGTALRGDKSPPVRAAAATALGRMEDDAVKAIPDLKAALKDGQQAVRAAAADALRRIAASPDRDAPKLVADALPELEQLVKDKNADHLGRAAAALAIGQVGAPEALPAVATLGDTAADDKAPADVRKAAAEALGRLGEDAGAAAGKLAAVLTAADAPPEVRRAAVEALDRFGPAAKPAAPALKKAASDGDKFTRVLSLHALGRLGPDLGADAKDVLAVLILRFDDDLIEVRVAAIQAVGAFGRDALGAGLNDAVARLTIAAGDSRPEVRDAATAALARLKGNP